MNPAAALLSVSFLVLSPLAADRLLRRGYELLPDDRWREELDRDRATDFLGMLLPSILSSSSALIDLNFAHIDYERDVLYPDVVTRPSLDLGLRAELDRWGDYDARILGHPPRTPYEPPRDALLPPR